MPEGAIQAHKSFCIPDPRFPHQGDQGSLPAMVFFAIGFNLIVLTTQLILDDYGAQLAGFMVATATALVVGKAVLVARALPFFRRFDTAPLDSADCVQNGRVLGHRVLGPILWKNWPSISWLAERLAILPEYVTTHFTWHRFDAIQIWIFVLFLIYVTAAELNTLLGRGEMFKIFFTRP